MLSRSIWGERGWQEVRGAWRQGYFRKVGVLCCCCCFFFCKNAFKWCWFPSRCILAFEGWSNGLGLMLHWLHNRLYFTRYVAFIDWNTPKAWTRSKKLFDFPMGWEGRRVINIVVDDFVDKVKVFQDSVEKTRWRTLGIKPMWTRWSETPSMWTKNNLWAMG